MKNQSPASKEFFVPQSDQERLLYEQSFHEFIRHRGGRLDTQRLDTTSQLYLESLKTQVQNYVNDYLKSLNESGAGRMPYVHVDIIDNASFNACAFVHEDREFIGFHYGAILILLDTFNRMMARNDIMTEIGSVALEENPDLTPFLSANYDFIQELNPSQQFMPAVRPKDSVRRRHADLMFEYAIKCLLLHELTHLLHGHIGYMKACTGRAFILEYDSNLGNSISPLTSQVIEWDADCGGASLGVDSVFSYLISLDEVEQLYKKYTTSADGAFITWGVSVHVLFRLVDAVRVANNRPMTNYYPSPYVRINTFMTLAMFILNQQDSPYSAEVISKNWYYILDQAELGLYKITSQAADRTQFLDYIERLEAGEHIDLSYEKHWKEVVRPALVPFSRIPNFAA